MRLIDFFDRGARFGPDHPVLRSETLSYGYAEAARLSARIANAMAARGADQDTRAAILTPNDIRGLICLLGIHRLGGTYVRLNFRSTAAETIHILREAPATWLFFHSDALPLIEEIREKVGTLHHFVCIDGALEGFECLDALMDRQADTAPRLLNAPDHVAMLASTGGTTGLPKLVMLADLNFETAVAAQLATMPFAGRPVFLVASAMTHAASSLMYAIVAQGGTIVVREHFDPVDVLETIERERVTHIYLPPTAIYMLLAEERARTTDYSSLRYLMYGAAPMAVEKLKEAMATFGPVMTQFYGQAECPMFISLLSPAEHEVVGDSALERRLASCGRPTPFCSVAIMDDEGALLPPDGVGEIAVQGNLLMRGYLNDGGAGPEAEGGWHRTGDVGYLDADGYLYIIDRKKDLIISGGFNVYPGEVEQFLWTHPAVRECAVIGTPHEKWGEEIRAVVCLHPGASPSEAELIAFCKAGLGSIKAPKRIEFRDELPKSAAGKILKREIRDAFWTGAARRI